MAAFRGSNEREFADASLRSTMIGDYSAIGFGRSMTEAFDELRTEQDRIVKCLKATVRTFRKLKSKDREEEEEEEDEFKDLSESIATSRYCEDRERLLDSLRQWTFDSAFQIGDNFVDAEKDAERIKRILICNLPNPPYRIPHTCPVLICRKIVGIYQRVFLGVT